MTTIRNGRVLMAMAAGGVLCAAHGARADLSWEHTGTVRVSTMKQPVFKFKMYNSWTANRYRVLLKYSVHGPAADMMQMMKPDAMETFAPLSALTPRGLVPMKTSPVLLAQASKNKEDAPPSLDKVTNFGGLALIRRTDDDRFIAYDSQTNRFIDEPARALLQRLRFNPWKALAPELARQAPPSFTDEQRARLVAEIRALTAPIRRRMMKVYFRRLATQRTFNGIPGHGYRLTQLNNLGGIRRGQQWVRTSIEWWLSDTQPGDEVVSQFREALHTQRQGLETPTASMWINEYFALAGYTGDETWREALETFKPRSSDAPGAFGPTPLQMSVSVALPPLQRAAIGDIRFDLALTRRSTDTLPNSVFTAPNSYTRWKPEPYLKKLDPYLNGSALKSFYDKILKEM